MDEFSFEKEISNALQRKNIYMHGMGHYYQAMLDRFDGRPLKSVSNNLKQAIKWIEISGNEIQLARVRLELAKLYQNSGEHESVKELVSPAAKTLVPLNKDMIPDELKPLVAELPIRDNFFEEILKLGQEMTSIRVPRELAVRILSTVIRVIGAERGALFMFDESEKQLSGKNDTFKKT